MIPKTLHYCWLSKDPMPPEAIECIKSWKKFMPDWTIKHWGMDDFDVHSVPFVSDAIAARKWAAAADYIRVYALYTEGGVYLDSDVLVRKKMDFVLNNRAFSAMEFFPRLADEAIAAGLVDKEGHKLVPDARIHGIQIQAAILGAEKGHPFFKDCLDYYNSHKFVLGPDGVFPEKEISPIVLANIAEKYGFEYLDKEQNLAEGFKLYPSKMFASQPYLMTPEAIAVHCCNASWRDSYTPFRHFVANMKVYLKKFLITLGLRREKAIERIR